MYSAFPENEAECYFNCCTIKGGYSGTALITVVKPIKVEFDLGITAHDGEGTVITVEYDEFVLVGAYVPNAGQDLKRLSYRTQEWDRDFYSYCHSLEESRKKPVIITGDLNVAHNEIDIYDTKGKEKVAGYTP